MSHMSGMLDYETKQRREAEKVQATAFAKAYLALCDQYKAEVTINQHGVHIVSLDEGDNYPFGCLIPEWNKVKK